jgi:hypothetical protein
LLRLKRRRPLLVLRLRRLKEIEQLRLTLQLRRRLVLLLLRRLKERE